MRANWIIHKDDHSYNENLKNDDISSEEPWFFYKNTQIKMAYTKINLSDEGKISTLDEFDDILIQKSQVYQR